VWAVWSVENRAACESLWASNLKDKISLTIMTEEAQMPDDLGSIVDLAIERHGAVVHIDIVDHDNVAEADSVMAEYAYARDSEGSVLSYRLSGGQA